MSFWDVESRKPRGLDDWRRSVRSACAWITDRSMVREPQPDFAGSQYEHLKRYGDWRGAFRGEYSAAQRRWDVYAPMWHGGQGVKALALAAAALGDPACLDAARYAAEFILRHQVRDPNDPDRGLLLAFENARINTTAILETVDGLFVLSEVSGEKRYNDAGLAAADWVARKAFKPEEGRFREEYDPDQRRFSPPYVNPATGRTKEGAPMLDDGIFVKAHRLTGNQAYLDIAVRTAERLLADEDPPGNWVCYPPANPNTRVLHPRNGYWWGRPMWMVAKATGESRFLDAARRTAQWYAQAMRLDGGLFRDTGPAFNTPSFGHATSGIACAAILWCELMREFGDTQWREPLRRALTFCYSAQFDKAADPNLQGAILEKVRHPCGSDAPPWYLRDIGTFFYVQAACTVLRDMPALLCEDK